MRQRNSRMLGGPSGKRGFSFSRSLVLLIFLFIASYCSVAVLYVRENITTPHPTESTPSSIQLPYEYPVHRSFPEARRTAISDLLRSRYFGSLNEHVTQRSSGSGATTGVHEDQRRRCWETAGLLNGSHACFPIFPTVPANIHEQLTLSGKFNSTAVGANDDDHAYSYAPSISGDSLAGIAANLEQEFSFKLDQDFSSFTTPQDPLLFYDGYDIPEFSESHNVNSSPAQDSELTNRIESSVPWWLFTPPPPSPTKRSSEKSPRSLNEDSWEDLFLEDMNLPCTAHIQRRLHALQNPPHCRAVRYLVSELKMGMHGVGSALSLVAHDLLSAIILKRVLIITIPSGSKWYFASDNCVSAGRGGWDCFFLPPSKCAYYDDTAIKSPSQTVEAPVFRRVPKPRAISMDNVRLASKSTQRYIQKKTIDASGMSRSDMPSDALFFGPGYESLPCYRDYLRWVNDDTNRILQGTFAAGADNRLKYMLAQTLKYLTRAPQPWFRSMLRFHFHRYGLYGTVGALHTSRLSTQQRKEEESRCFAAWYYSIAAPSSTPSQTTHSSVVMYVQERGEIAKFREYYNVFGCHTMNFTLFTDYVLRFCERIHQHQTQGNRLQCAVYISGNTPYERYTALREVYEENGIRVLSTWEVQPSNSLPNHQTTSPEQRERGSPPPESKRWGAGSPESSWIDLFAGVASAQWACVAQSNWCRLIDFLRLTSSRASCTMIDVGLLMMISPEDRRKYCIIGQYPTKPFSNVLRKYFAS